MSRRRARNHVIAGGFILLMAAAAAALLAMVGNWEAWTAEMQTLRIRFDQAPNLKTGAPLKLAGHPVGSVEDVSVVTVECEPGEEAVTCYAVEVTATLPDRFEIFDDARIELKQALVGQSSTINIASVGTSGKPAGEMIQGRAASAFSSAARELGIGEEEKTAVASIIANIRDLSAKLKTDLPEVIAKVRTAGANLAEISDKLKTAYPEMQKTIDDTLAKINEAAAEAENIVKENRPNIKKTVTHAASLAEKADTTGGEVLESAKGLVGDAREMVSDAKPRIQVILENAKAASKDLETSLADFKIVAKDGKTLVATHKGNVAKALTNFRATSEHLKALAKEVRRAPWRLFAKPDKEEVESINLYDVARAFASAATDLETFSDTLKVMVEAKKAGIDIDQEMIDQMVQRLEETFEKYREAEKALFEEFERIQK